MSQLTAAVISFVYLYLVMTSYYILKPVRESFFLGENGYKSLPIVHLLVLGATLVAAVIYTWLAGKLSTTRLMVTVNTIFLCCLVLFWGVLNFFGEMELVRKVFAWAYYCWVSVFAVFAMTMIWSIIHTKFSAKAGAWFYGTIGSGATLGAMSGGGVTTFFVGTVGTENLLLMAVLFLSPCMLLGCFLCGYQPREEDVVVEEEQDAACIAAVEPKEQKSAAALFQANPFLCMIGGIVFLTIFISGVDEYRYGKVVGENFQVTEEMKADLGAMEHEKHLKVMADARTEFYGKTFLYTNFIGLFISLGLTGLIQSRFGPSPGMYLYTFAILGTSVVFCYADSINVVFWSSVLIQSIAYSIFQWSRELLYTVTTKEEKLVAKGVIDTLLFRAGAATAAIALLMAGGMNWLTNVTVQMSYVTIPAALVMIGLIFLVSRQFKVAKQLRDKAVANI